MTKKMGLLQVYTGDGKGKTTASLGLALRAIGHGMKVCMIQFMKNSDIYGEVRLAEKMPGLTIIPVGRHDFVNLKNPEPIDIELAVAGWEKANPIRVITAHFHVTSVTMSVTGKYCP